MEIVGYSDRWSVAPGDRLSFHVSTGHERFDAALVRLLHGNDDPAGPGFREQAVASPWNGSHPGREQPFVQGSHVRVEKPPRIPAPGSFTLQAWLCPTAPGRHPEAVLGHWSGRGYGLFLEEDGALALRVGDLRFRYGPPLPAFAWHFAAASFDAEAGEARLACVPVRRWSPPAESVVEPIPSGFEWTEADGPFLIGACQPEPAHNFNGLIDGARVFGAALGDAAFSALREGIPPGQVDRSLLAAWDFGRDVESRRVADVSGSGHDGLVVNLGRRGVPGWNWSGDEVSHASAPGEFGAIFLHEEDMEDAGWDVAFEFTVPDGLRSGVYAARLRAGGAEDHVPFFVRPPRGRATAKIALLVPTYSYLAYANDHITWRNPAVPPPPGALEQLCQEDRYTLAHRLKGLYDRYEDDTGCCFSSRLRPVVNMRPRYRLAVTTTPHQFGADLHLADWLEVRGFEYDVVTDEDLHEEGAGLLSPYNAVLTGHHPEYTTAPMLDALEAYTAGGGRLMYLGGNGFYWVISTEPGHPHVIEVRRGQRGTSTWRGRPGEGWHSTTGEPGGLWRDRGRAPQHLAGIGMAAQGNGPARPYRRLPASRDPRAAFIFEGIGTEEAIGDFGLMLGGAGGIEVDRYDHALGTPPHALLLATADGFGAEYQHVVEEVETSDSKQGGDVNPLVRADMTFFETASGGAVFSVGSMTWLGSLSHAGYDNNVSRITENVLRYFSANGPLP